MCLWTISILTNTKCMCNGMIDKLYYLYTLYIDAVRNVMNTFSKINMDIFSFGIYFSITKFFKLFIRVIT